MQVAKFKNKPIDSNCYVVFEKYNNSCIIIDPGSPEISNLVEFCTINLLKPDYVILTHEHFDHIWGVSELKKEYNIKVVSTLNCSNMITSEKNNLSVFYNQIGFRLQKSDLLVEDLNFKLSWNNELVEFFFTPGHSNGSMLIKINNYLFSGDTIIPDKKTVTKLPSGNKVDLTKSMNFIKNEFQGRNLFLCPGHGEPQNFDNIV